MRSYQSPVRLARRGETVINEILSMIMTSWINLHSLTYYARSYCSKGNYILTSLVYQCSSSSERFVEVNKEFISAILVPRSI